MPDCVLSFGLRQSGVAELDFVRNMGRIKIIRLRFQQQHKSLRVCRQSAGQHTSSRATADDYHVIRMGPILY